MSEQPDLNQRFQSILKATIESYIATAEPVGSKVLSQKYDFNISAATIRNVMGKLENAGLLYQPHTSAGRIPSDSGYRLYVDRLLVPDEKVGRKFEQALLQQLSQEKASLEALIQRLTKLLAALSGYIAVISLPQNTADFLHHLQLVQVSSEQIVLIVVTDSLQTESILIQTEVFFDRETELSEEKNLTRELQLLSNLLNHHLRGRSLAEISTLDWAKDAEFAPYRSFLQLLSQEIGDRLQVSNDTPLAIHGIAEVLRQPEFSELQQVQTLFYLLEEEQQQLLPLIFSVPETSKNQKVKIRIGSENPLEPMQACTLISANYYADRTPMGSVGIIGPTRMLYDNTITLVETTADYLSDVFR